MTKNKKYYYGLMLIVVIFLVCFLRECTFPYTGTWGASESINESKYLKVFICEYTPAKKEVLIDNKYLFKFAEIWLEKSWYYTERYSQPKISTAKKGRFTMIITSIPSSSKNNLANHGIKWKFENSTNFFAKPEEGNIITHSLNPESINDTMELKIMRLNSKTNEFTDSIGTVRFFKVK